jgi:hypothetical protein
MRHRLPSSYGLTVSHNEAGALQSAVADVFNSPSELLAYERLKSSQVETRRPPAAAASP